MQIFYFNHLEYLQFFKASFQVYIKRAFDQKFQKDTYRRVVETRIGFPIPFNKFPTLSKPETLFVRLIKV